jgi:hypothetical protein
VKSEGYAAETSAVDLPLSGNAFANPLAMMVSVNAKIAK